MPQKSIYEQAADNYGEHTRDQVLKEDLVRRIIYAESGSLSVGTQVVAETTMDRLAVEFTYPGETTAKYDVDADATVGRQRMNWADFNMRLRQAQTRYFVSDGAKLEGMGDVQQSMMRRRASEALARRKDENILGALADGAISDNEDAESGGDEWNASGVDITDKLWSMWNDILVNAPLSNIDVSNFAVLLPVEIWTETNKLELINNIQQRVRDYVGQTYNFSLYPHKVGMHEDDELDLQDTAIMLIPGEDTATHGILDPNVATSRGVPLTESERVYGRGEDYLIRQWYNTGVYSHESGSDGKSPRIAVRTNVNTNA